MLQQTKNALRITATAYDDELVQLIVAGACDLQLAGIPVKHYEKDPLLKRAIITYVRCHFGSPSDYDRLKAAYDEQKAQLITATGYGLNQECHE